MSIRQSRLGHQIRDEISSLLQRGTLKDPRIGFATVTAVEVTKDLRQAKAYVSVFGDDDQANETIEALRRAKGFIRRTLGKQLRVRHIPELSFHLDRSVVEGMRMSELIQSLPEFQEETGSHSTQEQSSDEESP